MIMQLSTHKNYHEINIQVMIMQLSTHKNYYEINIQ